MNDERRDIAVPIGPLVASLGAVLLIVSLFLDWYDGRTGFTVFEVLDLLLVAGALLVIVQLAGGMGITRAAVSPGVSLAVTIVTLVIVASQAINHPPAAVNVDKATGIWLGLAGAGVMVIGAILATAHISLSVEPRSGRPGAPPPARADDESTRPLGDPAPGEREP